MDLNSTSVPGAGEPQQGGNFMNGFPRSESLIDPTVLHVALQASAKLLLVCFFVILLMKSRLLPESTPAVLSQVAFRMLIPCFMMTKMAITLATEASPSLFAIPVVAVAQVAAGAALGKVVWRASTKTIQMLASCRKMFWESVRSVSLSPQRSDELASIPLALATSSNEGREPSSSVNEHVIGCTAASTSACQGTDPQLASSVNNPNDLEDAQRSESTAEITSLPDKPMASTLQQPEHRLKVTDPTSMDSGEEQAGSFSSHLHNHHHHQQQQQQQQQEEALVMATCAFGNAGLLPLVFLSGLLGHQVADKAGGYLALFILGWSPALWTIGYQIITKGVSGPASQEANEGPPRGGLGALGKVVWKILNPPLYGVLLGVVVGGTPIARYALPPSYFSKEVNGQQGWVGVALAAVLRPAFEAASFLGTAFIAIQTVVLASSLSKAVPDWNVGGAASLQRAAHALFTAFKGLKDKLHRKDGEKDQSQSLVGSPRKLPSTAASEISSSSQPRDGPECGRAQRPHSPPSLGSPKEGDLEARPCNEEERGEEVQSEPVSQGSQGQQAKGTFREADVLRFPEAQALSVVLVVRMLLLPAAGSAFILLLSRAGIIPKSKLCQLLLMTQTCMPSAQNLVLVAQLNKETQPLAIALSSLLLKQYVLAIFPVTVWLSVFLGLISK